MHLTLTYPKELLSYDGRNRAKKRREGIKKYSKLAWESIRKDFRERFDVYLRFLKYRIMLKTS